MITELRKRHRLFFTTIAPGLVCLSALGLYFRPSVPFYREENFEKNFSAALSHASPHDGIAPRKNPGESLLLSKKIMRLRGILTTVRTWKLGSRYWLSLHTQGESWPEPDLLLYVQKTATEELSPKAYLLGSLTGRKGLWFVIPKIDKSKNYIYGRSSVFILYSLGHSKIVARFRSQDKLP